MVNFAKYIFGDNHMNNFPACLTFTLQMEGGWSDNPNDPGGCTMEGIILSTYQNWKNDQTLTCSDLQNISSDEVSSIYQQNYWTPIEGDSLMNGVDLMVFDMGVNAGTHGSAKLLQASLGVSVDGDIGPETLSAANSMNAIDLINRLAQHQAAYYRSLSDFQYFGNGWLNRVNARHAAALQLTNNVVPMVQTSYPVATKASAMPSDDFFNSIFNLHKAA